LHITDSGEPKLTLQQLREAIEEARRRKAEEEAKSRPLSVVAPSVSSTLDRFQPNDPSVLLAQLPIHEGNSWCDLSITCSDQLRLRAPFFFYEARFDRLSKSQADQLEHWQTTVHKNCERQRSALQRQLEKCHSFNTLLGHMRPKCWQTGLLDMSQQYAYRYKEARIVLVTYNWRTTIARLTRAAVSFYEASTITVQAYCSVELRMMKQFLGHNHHDRNSSRQPLIRYEIPFNLLDLEGMSALKPVPEACRDFIRCKWAYYKGRQITAWKWTLDSFCLITYTLPFFPSSSKGLSPMDYLKKFCILADTRIPYYQRIFTKHKDGRTHLIPSDKLLEPLKALMSGAFYQDQVDELVRILDLTDEAQALDEHEFCCVCGLAERLYYTKNLRIFGEEGLAMQQGILESADFHMFVKKMDGVKITRTLSRFLQRLGLYK
uniref:PCI domain-containing protein n=1 Tax=Schistocephalus solidus TaxID=70667 RepID=A0A183SLC8_SCHSO